MCHSRVTVWAPRVHAALYSSSPELLEACSVRAEGPDGGLCPGWGVVRRCHKQKITQQVSVGEGFPCTKGRRRSPDVETQWTPGPRALNGV